MTLWVRSLDSLLRRQVFRGVVLLIQQEFFDVWPEISPDILFALVLWNSVRTPRPASICIER